MDTVDHRNSLESKHVQQRVSSLDPQSNTKILVYAKGDEGELRAVVTDQVAFNRAAIHSVQNTTGKQAFKNGQRSKSVWLRLETG